MSLSERIRTWLQTCRDEVKFWRAVSVHPHTPRTAKWLIGSALAYLLWPVDLVPDWIPVLGQLDDILLVGLALWVAWRLIPKNVIDECRKETGA